MSPVDDFFRSRLDQMIDLRHPLAVLASRMPWQEIEASLALQFARQAKAGKTVEDIGLFGPEVKVVGGGKSNASRPPVTNQPRQNPGRFTLKTVMRLSKEFGFTAGLLKGSLTE